MNIFQKNGYSPDGKKAMTMERRTFLKIAAMSGFSTVSGLWLVGCEGWTPRSTGQASSLNSQSDVSTSNISPADVLDGMALIQGATFQMGSPDSESWRGEDEVLHEVVLSNFYLSPYEVTQQQYMDAMDANPSANSSQGYPVENVTWVEALAFCNELSAKSGLDPAYTIEGERATWNKAANGYRLPTEAEWEFACRAGTTTPFNTQTSISADTDANYYVTYPYEIERNYFAQGNLETGPGVYRQHEIEVGSFAPNAWGLYDMHGNVGEWVWDAYGSYDASDAQVECDVVVTSGNRGNSLFGVGSRYYRSISPSPWDFLHWILFAVPKVASLY